MTKHKQVEIYHSELNKTVEVDEGISELIELLWELDVGTRFSCQEDRPGIIWIQFSNDSAEHFLNTVSYYRDEEVGISESLYKRMVDSDLEGGWEIEAVPYDEAYEDLPSYMWFEISIRFPSSDYEKILKRVRNFVYCREMMKKEREELVQ
jgi:hypothetical protein